MSPLPSHSFSVAASESPMLGHRLRVNASGSHSLPLFSRKLLKYGFRSPLPSYCFLVTASGSRLFKR